MFSDYLLTVYKDKIIPYTIAFLKLNQSVKLLPVASRTAEDNDGGPPSNRQRQELVVDWDTGLIFKYPRAIIPRASGT